MNFTKDDLHYEINEHLKIYRKSLKHGASKMTKAELIKLVEKHNIRLPDVPMSRLPHSEGGWYYTKAERENIADERRQKEIDYHMQTYGDLTFMGM